MKTFLLFLACFLVVDLSYAESIKDRLRRAREAEATPLAPDETFSPEIKAVEPTQEKAKVDGDGCSQETKESNGMMYHHGCFCRNEKYPDLEENLKKRGLKFEAKGIQEYGTGVVQMTDSERNQLFYLCGAELKWDRNNPKFYKTKDECDKAVQEAVNEAMASGTPILATAAFSGCAENAGKYKL